MVAILTPIVLMVVGIPGISLSFIFVDFEQNWGGPVKFHSLLLAL